MKERKTKLTMAERIAKIKEKPSIFIYSVLLVIFATAFLVCATILALYYINSSKQTKQHNELASIVEQVQQEINTGSNNIVDSEGKLTVNPENPLLNNNNIYVEVTNPDTGEIVEVLREYATVYLMNTDMVGWIKIPGTNVNYPVLQHPDEQNYYLKRDFYKQNARHGSIFAHEMADFKSQSDNITLYGHNMGDDSMFAGLHQYENPEFYNEHPYILFDTLTSHQIYKVLYVFYIDITQTPFRYHEFVDGNEDEFNEFITDCTELAMYDTGDTAVHGTKLLTLSTCDNNVLDDNMRFVVVAKKVSL